MKKIIINKRGIILQSKTYILAGFWSGAKKGFGKFKDNNGFGIRRFGASFTYIKIH